MLCRKGVPASAISIDRMAVGGHLFIGYFSTFNDAQISSNHYQVLGINQHASQEEIKKAFFTLSKKYHPDMLGSNSGDYSTQKFLQIREAYDTLRDEQKRREYDQQLGKRQKWLRNAHYWREEDDWELNHRMAQNRENIQHQQKWRKAAERPPFSGYGPSFRASSSSTWPRSNEIPTWSSLYHIWRAMIQEQNSHRFQQTVERNNRNTANRNYPTPEEMKAERRKAEQQRQQNWWTEYQQREQKQAMSDTLWSLLGKHFHISQLFIIVLFIIFLIKYE